MKKSFWASVILGAALVQAGPVLAVDSSTPLRASMRVLPGNAVALKANGDAATAVTLNMLREQAAAKGAVRLIVGLRVPFAAEGQLAAADASLQRNEIAMQQTAVLGKVASLQKKPEAVKRFATIPFMALEVNSSELEALAALTEISSVEEDQLAKPALTQSVPLIGGSTAWSGGYSGAGQTVAVLDTGVDKTHVFLTGKVVSEACYSTAYAPHGASSVCPGGVAQSTASGAGVSCASGVSGCNHGTHVAGIVAGNGATFAGVAKDASVIAIQVFSRVDSTASCGSSSPCALTYTSDQILGLERVYALRNTYSIAAVNMSLGGGEYFSQSSCDAAQASRKAAIDTLRSVNIATVIASGNEGYTGSMAAPGCISSAVSVGSTWDAAGSSNNCDGNNMGTSSVDAVACYSNSASFLNLLAPGSLINSSVPGGSYSNFQGTSMAAPHVAGAWAVLKQKSTGITVADALSALSSTGQSVTDARNGIVKPRIRLDAALNALGGSTCSYTLSPASQTVAATASTGTVNVSAASTCTWSASSNASWISITAGASGTGNGSVSYAVSANTSTSARSGTLTIGGQTFSVTQSGSSGGGSTSNLLSNPGFENGTSPWSETSSGGYRVITNEPAGAAYAGSYFAWFGGYDSATDTLSQSVTIPGDAQSVYLQFMYRISTQETSSTTSYDYLTIDLYSSSGAKLATLKTFSNLNAVSAWTQSAQFDLSAYRGQTVTLKITGTTDSSSTSSFYLDDLSLLASAGTVTCSNSLSGTAASAAAAGATGSVSVTAASGCAWTASSNVSWITVSSGASGSGNGSVGYTVAANSSTTARSGTLTIAGQTFTVTQAGASCVYTISQSSQALGSNSANGSVSVSAPDGCAWTAASNAAWVSISSGASGSGNGKAGYSVSANSGTASRSGTLTIAGHTFTLTQATTSLNNLRHALFISPSSNTSMSNVVRLINFGSQSGEITATAYDESGVVAGTGNFVIGTPNARQMLAFTSAQLEAALGYTPSSSSIKYRIVFNANLASFKLINFIKDGASGNLTLAQPQIENRAAGTASSSSRNVLFFNPSTSSNKTSVVRLSNLSDQSGALTATAYDEAGNVVGTAGASLGTLAAQQTRSFNSAQLESAIGYTPASGTAKYHIVISAALPSFEVVNFIKDVATGSFTLGQEQID